MLTCWRSYLLNSPVRFWRRSPIWMKSSKEMVLLPDLSYLKMRRLMKAGVRVYPNLWRAAWSSLGSMERERSRSKAWNTTSHSITNFHRAWNSLNPIFPVLCGSNCAIIILRERHGERGGREVRDEERRGMKVGDAKKKESRLLAK